MRIVLVTKWALQDYASRLLPLLPPVCQAPAPAEAAAAAAEPQQGAAAGGGTGTTPASGPHSTDSSSDHGNLGSEREAAAGHTVAALPAVATHTTIPHEGKQLTDMVVSGTGAADSQPSSQAAPATGEEPVFVSTPSGTSAPQLGGTDSDVQRRAKRVVAGADGLDHNRLVQRAAGGAASRHSTSRRVRATPLQQLAGGPRQDGRRWRLRPAPGRRVMGRAASRRPGAGAGRSRTPYR